MSASEIAEWAAEFKIRHDDEEEHYREMDEKRAGQDGGPSAPPGELTPEVERDLVRQAIERGHLPPDTPIPE